MSPERATVSPLQQRAARGAVVLFGQSVLVKLVAVVGGVVLARLLSPEQFGIYGIVSFVAAFLSTFSDAGLGAALIQQRDQPTRDDLTTVFSAQAVLVSCVVVIGWIASEAIGRAYGMSNGSAWLIRVLLLSLPIGLLRTVPAILLERELRYGRLSAIEATEALTFQSVAIVLSVTGLGVWSLIWAVIARGVTGVAVAYVVSPWRPGIQFSRPIAARLLRFGIPYQAQGVLSFIKDSMTPTLIALIAGATAVGYINWAFALATAPLLVTEPLWRVTFPAFARAQHDLVLLRSMIERSIRLSAIVFLPLSFLLLCAGPQIVRYVYVVKWAPALPAFYLFSISLWTGPLLGASFYSAFYAMGRTDIALRFTLLYGVLDWAVGVPLVLYFGFNGMAIRAVLVAYGTIPLLLHAMNGVVPMNALRQVVRPFLVAAGAGAFELLLLRVLPSGLVELVVACLLASAGYSAAIAVWERGPLSAALLAVLPSRVHPAIRWYTGPAKG